MLRAAPITLFDATDVAASSLSGLLFPGTGNTCTGPARGSGGVAPILNGSNNVCGGVIAPGTNVASLRVAFAALGADDLNLVMEVGQLDAAGGLAWPYGTLTVASCSVTVVNKNPFDGSLLTGTWRLFDTATLPSLDGLAQVLTNIGGAADNTPSQMRMSVIDAVFYYFILTNLDGLTRVICSVVPQ